VDPTQSLEQQAIDFARRGDFGPDAKRANEELTKLAPGNPGAWTRLARCCMTLGQLDAATHALETALALNPQNTIASSLQMEVSRQRARLTAPIPPPKRKRAPPSKSDRKVTPMVGGFGRPEFAALAQLSPEIAIDTLGPRIEALLMALNERSFAEKVVEARNRAAQPGSRVFRRNSFHSGGAGHIYAFQHGGRWEPQLHVGIFAASQWRRDGLCAGIGFNLSPGSADGDELGQERVASYFDRFRQLVSSDWRQLLIDWMTANGGGFIQYADAPPETDRLPKDAIDALIRDGKAGAEWIFCGRWLFADRPGDAATLQDAGKLTRWIEQTFTDLLPLWMSVYRK
jgi:hypothetical protein